MSAHRGIQPSAYEEHAVGPQLREIAVCTWTRPASGVSQLTVLPDGCVDLVWRSDGRLFVAGPDAGPAVHHHPSDAGHDGIRLRTGVAGTVLDTSAEELAGAQVDLSALWGPSARVLAARLEAAGSPRARRAELAAIVSERLADARPPDAPVLAAAEALAVGDARVHDVAAAVGLSERQLHRRMCHQVGYGPKTLDRILRFQRFVRLAPAVRAGRTTLGRAAAAAGYADQSHLVRECRRLAGATPSQVVRRPAVDDV
jgi:AraC-like DNA-binding protein